MEPTRLPVLRCFANCTRCGSPTEFSLFESGVGGDFATFVGERSGSLYRLDLGKVHYQRTPLAILLAPAVEREGGSDALSRLPENILCKVCGNVYAGTSMSIGREDVVSAYEL